MKKREYFYAGMIIGRLEVLSFVKENGKRSKWRYKCIVCGRDNIAETSVVRDKSARPCRCDNPGSNQFVQTMSIEDRFWSRLNKKSGDGCWEWTGGLSLGYGALWDATCQNNVGAHCFSWRLHFGDVPDGLFVCHECDNRRCVRPDHLFLGTNGDNQIDSIKKNRGGRSVLTVSMAIDLCREFYCGDYNIADLSRKYGVHFSTAASVVTGDSWGHVTGVTKEKFQEYRRKQNDRGHSHLA